MKMDKSERGAALIAAAWTTFLLSLLSIGILSLTLTARETVSSLQTELQDELIAKSALRVFLKQHFYNVDEKAFLSDAVSVMDEHVEVLAEFESGKINLNRASASLLSALFVNAGSDESTAWSQASAIIDWRDKNDEPEEDGAEAEQYLAAGRLFGPRNSPFESVGELKLVLGIDPDLFYCVAPLLTVSSLFGEVDVAFAGDAVRSVLQWAFDNQWNGQVWPDPTSVQQAGSIVGAANTLGGQAISLRMTVSAEQLKHYRALVRFKNTSDVSFEPLGPLERDLEPIGVENCPWI